MPAQRRKFVYSRSAEVAVAEEALLEEEAEVAGMVTRDFDAEQIRIAFISAGEAGMHKSKAKA